MHAYSNISINQLNSIQRCPSDIILDMSNQEL